MTKNQIKKEVLEKEGVEEVRRSTRVRAPAKEDYYVYGIIDYPQIQGLDYSEEDYRRKRHRKNYRGDDSSEFSDLGRPPKKKLHPNKKVETLLEWKIKLPDQPSNIENNSTYHQVKSVCNENLEKYGKGIEAIFINIVWGTKGQTIQDFKKIKIDSNILLSKGLVFIWTPKQMLYELMQIMDKKGFFYVENFEIVNLDRNKAVEVVCEIDKMKKSIGDETSQNGYQKAQKQLQYDENDDITLIRKLNDVEPKSLIMQQQSKYFNESKKTLLIFRKTSNEKIQLRHQRTCDVVFDLTRDGRLKCSGDIKKYVMKMIETMLPRGLEVEEGKKSSLKLMELWAEPDARRKGWIQIGEK